MNNIPSRSLSPVHFIDSEFDDDLMSDSSSSEVRAMEDDSTDDSSSDTNRVTVSFTWQGNRTLRKFKICEKGENVVFGEIKILDFFACFKTNQDVLTIEPLDADEPQTKRGCLIKVNTGSDCFETVAYEPEELKAMKLYIRFSHTFLDLNGIEKEETTLEKLSLNIPKNMQAGDEYQMAISEQTLYGFNKEHLLCSTINNVFEKIEEFT